MKSQIKKLISVFACVCLLLTAIIIPVSAETTATITFDADKANRVSYSTDQQVWQQNGITVTNNKASGSNVGDYANPVRFYKNSEVIIEYPGMTQIVVAASTAKYAQSWADSNTDANATVTVADTTATIVFATAVNSYTITLTSNQTRVSTMTITGGDVACPHTDTSTTVENQVEATCTTTGSYDNVVTCNACGEEVSRETIVVSSLGHTAGEAVQENVVGSTCTDNGSYDSVVYCTVCNEEISRETVAGEIAPGHTPGQTVTENVVEPTCTTDGSYENVVYCSVCDAELLREKWTSKPATGHNFNAENVCTICGSDRFTNATIYVSEINGTAGETVTVDVNLINNPGIVSAKILIGYDADVLELVGRTAGENFATMAFSPLTKNPFTANWVDTLNPDNTTNGTFVTLTFKIKDDAVLGYTPITVTYSQVDIYNFDYEDVVFEVANGGITVAECQHTSTSTVVENEVALSCTQDAQHDSVVYCDNCSAEISRETIVTEIATGHSFNAENLCDICGASKFTAPTIYVDTVNATVGETITVDVNLANNPGIISAKLSIGYDSDVLELVGRTAGSGFAGMAFGPTTNNPFVANWVDSLNPDNTTNGTFVTLSFKVKDGAAIGLTPITVTYIQADVYDSEFVDVVFDTVSGGVEVAECQHTSTSTVVENEVAVSCTQDGQQDNVVYCDNCGAEVSRETVVTEKATGHSFNAENVCDVCGASKFTDPTIYIDNISGTVGETVTVNVNLANNPGIISAKLKVGYDSNVLELISATPGSGFAGMAFGPTTNNPFVANWIDSLNPDNATNGIFVTLTFKIKTDATEGLTPITVTYLPADVFNAEYADVTFAIETGSIEVAACPHSNNETVEENRIDATCTADGSYESVVYCLDCGLEISRETVVIAALGHTQGEAVEENRVEAYCETDGSYDLVVYCTVCGEELSRETIVIDALGHDIVNHEAKAPTCTEIGWDAYDTCSRCDYITYVEIAALGHTEAEAVEENRVDATCTEDGSYDLVVYCATCGEELSRETVVIDALGHTAGEAVEENRVEATCTEAGSYDVVVYCTVCGAELSRETVVIDALGHTEAEAIEENRVEATCTEAGSYESVVYCATCGEELSRETVVIDALGHTEGEAVEENRVNATCTEAGSYESVVYCATCGEELSREVVVIDALGHTANVAVSDLALTVDSLGLASQSYSAGTATVDGVDFEWIQLGNYGNGIQVRDKNGNVSTLWNTTAFSAPIKEIRLVFNSEKKTFDNSDAEIFSFGTEAGTYTYSTKLSTTADVKEYVITPDAEIYTYLHFEHDLGYTMYWDSITIVFASAGGTVEENRVEATCTENGSYDNVVYCATCGEEVSRETVVIDALGHTAGEAVEENHVDATCTQAGSYDVVVYCTVCDAEISRETFEIPVVAHTDGAAVVENRIDATCDTAGSFDVVVYCSECGEELTRLNVAVDALGHSYGEATVVAPEYGVEGYTVHTCTLCGHEEKFDFVDALTYVLGDVNGDEAVNNRDVAILMQWLNEWDVDNFVEAAADVNGDGFINNRDQALLMQYVNNWDVELG